MKTAAKILIPILAFIATFSLIFFGLGFIFQGNSQAKPIFLKVVGLWDPRVFNVLKEQFQDQNPEVTIEYEQKNSQRYFTNLKADLKTPKTADVYWWHSSWGSQLEPFLADLPPDVLTASEYEKTYYPITKTDMKLKGSYRGIPLEIDGLALLYNKSIFASSNFSEPPKTWLSLREKYIPSLTLRNDKQIFSSGIALGSVANVENFSEIVGLLLLQNGVAFTDKGQLTLYDQKNKEGAALASDAINFFYLFSRKDKTWDNTQPNSIEAFAKGKTAMIILPAYKIHQLEEILKTENLKLKFGVEPLPQLPEAQSVTWGSYWALGVGEKSQEKSSSWKLVKFLSGPSSLRTIFNLESELFSFGRAYPRMEMAREQTTHPYLAAYLVQANDAKSWYLNSDTHDNGLNDEVVAEFKKTMAKIENGGDTDGSLKKLAFALSPILKKYGIITQAFVKKQ